MSKALLTRHSSHRTASRALQVFGEYALTRARAHEVCGSARRRLALWIAAELSGPLIWVRPDWHPDRLHMEGVAQMIDPGRILTTSVKRGEDLLWVLEEVLRAGVVPLVVGELPEPPGLTPVRRLHLAAETGDEARGQGPICLLLTPGNGGAAGVESRWQLSPDHRPDQSGWTLSRLRARQAPPKAWQIKLSSNQRPKLVQAA